MQNRAAVVDQVKLSSPSWSYSVLLISFIFRQINYVVVNVKVAVGSVQFYRISVSPTQVSFVTTMRWNCIVHCHSGWILMNYHQSARESQKMITVEMTMKSPKTLTGARKILGHIMQMYKDLIS